MIDSTDNIRITQSHPLMSPAVIALESPLTATSAAFVREARSTVSNILRGDDQRLMVVVGPCSIHDVDSALAYADQLARLAERVEEKLYCVMRVYFEKPRTTVGWKGLINDPDLDGSFRINKGLQLARRLLANLADRSIPAATEFLDTTFGQYYADLITWGAIGARTVESQIHRQLASGLSMPVGVKNGTDGNITVAVEALQAIRHGHLFPSLTKEGAPVIFETAGNEDAHLVLRGGRVPNYAAADTAKAHELLVDSGLTEAIMVDCSHGNSQKQPERQIDVARDVVGQRVGPQHYLRAIMLESHLIGGRQELSGELAYGQSITDACLSFAETEKLLLELADALR